MSTSGPYLIAVKDPQRDLVDPAVNGTRRVLDACRRAGVRRVILTSSMAAITDEPDSGRVLTEADWNTKSTLTRNPYYLSKTLAEREAWTIVNEEKAGFELVVINPFTVIGQSLASAQNTSTQMFAGERLSMREVVGVMREIGVRGKLPTLAMDNAAGTALVKLLSWFQPKGVGSYLRSHLGRVPAYDNGKIRRELGLEFRPARNSVLDTLDDLRQRGLIQVS